MLEPRAQYIFVVHHGLAFAILYPARSAGVEHSTMRATKREGLFSEENVPRFQILKNSVQFESDHSNWYRNDWLAGERGEDQHITWHGSQNEMNNF